MDATSKRTRQILIILAIIFVAIAIVSILTAVVTKITAQNKGQRVYVTNLDSCSKNMRSDLQDKMSETLYTYVKAANDYNKVSTADKYTATIRDNSCQQKDTTTASDASNVKIEHTSATLDIPDAKQSWALTYSWVANGANTSTDFGPVVVNSCLTSDQLIYGDFHCASVLSLQQYGTANADPILQYMPYSGAGFDLAYNADAKEVTATINLEQSQKDNQVLINNLKGQVAYWFTHRALDINNYKVTYVLNVQQSTPTNFDD